MQKRNFLANFLSRLLRAANCVRFCSNPFVLFCLFDFILYVPSTIFQINRNGSSWVEPVLS